MQIWVKVVPTMKPCSMLLIGPILPVVAMLLLVNMVMGLISRVSPQMNVFSVGFPLTLAAGLTGLWLTLPLMQAPLTMAIERMLAQFQ